jgi:dienelactone hydrolase
LKALLTRSSWVIHGDDDSVVYLRQAQAFVDLVKDKLPETKLQFDVAKGHDHAFDVDPAYWKEYAGPAMEFLSSNWLQ